MRLNRLDLDECGIIDFIDERPIRLMPIRPLKAYDYDGKEIEIVCIVRTGTKT